MKPLDIAIVGYGTAGQAASLFLQRDGHRITHFEQAPVLQPVGAGFLLQPTGLSVLKALGLDGIAHRHGARIERLYGENERGRRIMDMRYAEIDPQWHGLGMQRGALFELLRDADAHADAVITGTRIEGVDTVRGLLSLADGSTHGPYDLILLADGAHSPLRAKAGIAVREDALYPWGAIWCLAADTHGRFGSSLEQRYRCAREMCGVLPVGTRPGAPDDKRVSLFWSVPTAQLDATLAGGIAPVREAIGRLWPDAAVLCEGMVDLTAWRRASYRDVVVKRPFRERVVLIGDAAHGMSPQLGQGANMALLDARVLAGSLSSHANIEDALADYARQRRDHLRIYQFLSRWLTPLFQSDHDALAWWRDLLFLPLSRMPYARGDSLRILSGVKKGWFGKLDLGADPSGQP